MRYVPPGLPGSIVSVGPREAEDFSLPAGDNLRFVTRLPPVSRRSQPTKTFFPPP
jgi:hypothetical protein